MRPNPIEEWVHTLEAGFFALVFGLEAAAFAATFQGINSQLQLHDITKHTFFAGVFALLVFLVGVLATVLVFFGIAIVGFLATGFFSDATFVVAEGFLAGTTFLVAVGGRAF